MITKKELIGHILDMQDQIDYLYEQTTKLEKEIRKIKPAKQEKDTGESKRKPGRPHKNK